MKKDLKALYVSPTSEVVEMKVSGTLCYSYKTINWTYDQDSFNPDGFPDIDGYGDVYEIDGNY